MEPAFAWSVAANPLELVVFVVIVKVRRPFLVTLDTHSVILVVHYIFRMSYDVFLVKQVVIVALVTTPSTVFFASCSAVGSITARLDQRDIRGRRSLSAETITKIVKFSWPFATKCRILWAELIEVLGLALRWHVSLKLHASSYSYESCTRRFWQELSIITSRLTTLLPVVEAIIKIGNLNQVNLVVN